ncbi:MAG: hypothetical protein KAW47_09285 [Thermoplasmatales archaeon]|nr:hypothetical protein [Thermoplasmatales archaeon]
MIDEEATFKRFGYYASDLSPHSAKKIVAVCDDCGKVRVVHKQVYRALCRTCCKKGERHPQFGKKGKNRPNGKGGEVKRICEICGTEFPISPSIIKNGYGRFCSRKCAGEHQSKSIRGENNPSWQGGKVKRICEICGTEFPLHPSLTKNGEGRFCSRECAAKWCSEQFKGENNPNWRGGKVKGICEICGKEVPTIPSVIKKGNGRFCSLQCAGKWYSKHFSGKNSPQWKGGLSFEPYCIKFDFAFKEYIRDKFGRICFLCPKTEEENGKRLSVHHVNYNKDCGCDGDETCQFVPLCIGCNAKVNSNRKMWEKKIKDMMKNKLNGWYI